MDLGSRLRSNPQFCVQYIESLTNWRLWIEQADRLLEACKILRPHIDDYWRVVADDFREGRYDTGRPPPHVPPTDPHDGYFILVSYALEDLLKAVIIRDKHSEIDHQFLATDACLD